MSCSSGTPRDRRPARIDSFWKEVVQGAAGTGISRVTGLIRDGAIAYAFGASASYDAFLVALFIPNALRQLLGEGGLAAAFIPVYTSWQKRGQGTDLARSTLGLLLGVLPAVCALGALAARWYLPFLAAGFPPEKMGESVALAAWLFPLLGFVSLTALFGGILNAHGRFFGPAVAPAVLNLGMALGAVVLSRLFPRAIFGLAAGALLGGLVMTVALLPATLRYLKGPLQVWPLHPGLREVGWRLLPSLGGLVVAEANVLVDNRLASYLAHGSIAVLQYAMRLFQLPLGVLAVSVASAALPRLARAPSPGTDFARTLSRGFHLTAALVLPAMVGLLLLGQPILTVLFERGAFGRSDTARTFDCLAGYLSGLWAYALVYLFSRAHFALGRPALPFAAAALALGVNVGLNLWWVGVWGAFGLALATGVAGWVDALVLGGWLWRKVPGWIKTSVLARIAAAAGVMGGAVWGARILLGGQAPWLQVVVGVPVGVLVYGLAGWALGLRELVQGER